MDSNSPNQAAQPLLTGPDGQVSELSTRQWDWIVAQVGNERALDAIAQLGNRRPYPLNVAKFLRLQMPAEGDLPATPEMQQRGAEARARLKQLREQFALDQITRLGGSK